MVVALGLVVGLLAAPSTASAKAQALQNLPSPSKGGMTPQQRLVRNLSQTSKQEEEMMKMKKRFEAAPTKAERVAEDLAKLKGMELKSMPVAGPGWPRA